MPNKETPGFEPGTNLTFDPARLETIDQAVYKFVNESLNPHTTTNKGFSKVPILWLGTERPYQIKNDKELRDSVGRLILPLITVTRTSVTRDDWKGSYQSYYPAEGGYGGGVTRITRIVQQEKTRNYANTAMNRKVHGEETGRVYIEPQQNKQVVWETITVPKPTYVTCLFEVNIRTEYQQQMNDLIPAFIVDQRNVYPISHGGYKYELFIQDDYGLNNNIGSIGTEERMFGAKVQFKVLGYLLGDGVNRNRPQITRKQNIVKVVIAERLGDTNPNTGLVGIGTFEGQVEYSGSEIGEASTKTHGEFREF